MPGACVPDDQLTGRLAGSFDDIVMTSRGDAVSRSASTSFGKASARISASAPHTLSSAVREANTPFPCTLNDRSSLRSTENPPLGCFTSNRASSIERYGTTVRSR
jgi:hypothetical protein